MGKIENESGIPSDGFHREGLIDRLAQYLAAEPKAWHVRYNLAVALMHSDEIDEAAEQFRQVLAYAPKHMESMVNLGGIYLSRGESDEALKIFISAVKAWDVPVVRANLAVAYMQKERLEEAEEELRRALDLNPNMPDALTNLGFILIRTGRLKEAVAASKRALEIRDDFAMAHNNLAVAMLELGQKDEAKQYALKAKELGYPVPEGLLEDLGIA